MVGHTGAGRGAEIAAVKPRSKGISSPTPGIYIYLRLKHNAAIAHVAQQVEHFLGKEEVTDSNSVVGSRDIFL